MAEKANKEETKQRVVLPLEREEVIEAFCADRSGETD